ncbi:hypothetical protein TVAG_071880 [Trichomonas vaginalis G3]|uniref:DUF3447 domain-containing protein n=1 Tax=Trichomonas vaginalis (strain ATCC PRA-98 / G3) TaxID=412133 RepID=A2D891_TRIV3|nr:proteasome regulatory particle assembly [Trichomonas vaginalis G3]EAY23524.1 hypothetical protein TVAG_071880 [Trichomonas vaginalis G3]KAI5493946.1 proteasome regulatory particle assembly [Trichomonas vaginalis G3]|eukprot:XP_001584510.1 hypothetical protein [Trichomonas vaginalis G3]
MSENIYNEIMDLVKEKDQAIKELFRLRTYNEKEIDMIYKNLKDIFIETKILLPTEMMGIIFTAAKLNNKYLKSYIYIFRKIYDEYFDTIKIVSNSSLKLFDENYSSDYKIFKDSLNEQNQLLSIFDNNPLYKAILDDDIKLFISIIESFDSDISLSSQIRNNLFPYFGTYSLIELCCYYGAVNCFKYLILERKSKITSKCLLNSFLSGIPDILNECLKYFKPDLKCMEYAISLHNIDFTCFLNNEFGIKIDTNKCIKYYNLQALAVYIDKTKDVNIGYVMSPLFNIHPLSEYFILHGSKINSKNKDWKNALHYAAMKNSKEIAKFLVSKNIDISARDINGFTALHYAVKFNSIETLETIVSNSSSINFTDVDGSTALHNAARNNNMEILEMLIKHGANVNEKDKYGRTALSIATFNNS